MLATRRRMVETLVTAAEQVEAVLPAGGGIAEVVGDKGYHSNQTLVGLADLGLRRYVSEPDRGRRCWQGKPVARDGAFGVPGGSVCCASAANAWSGPTPISTKPGGLRRVYMRGHTNILKHLLVHACGFNLGFLMRQQTGVGTPRSLQGRVCALVAAQLAPRVALK